MSDTIEDAEEPLYLHELLERFDQASPSDILRLGKLTAGEILRILLDAIDRRQFVFRVNHPDGWVVNTLTTHGTIAVSQDAAGRTSFAIAAPAVNKGTLDIAEQVRATQERQKEEGKGWWTETGEQFGRWFL